MQRSRSVLRALPDLVRRAPAGVLIGVGALLVLLGGLILTRPLTSIVLLALYVSVSAIVWGIVEFVAGQDSGRLTERILGLASIGLGLAVLVWFGRSLDLLPSAIAVLLIVAGLGSLSDVLRGRWSARILAGAWGAAQIVFGALALVWPDVTVFVVAMVFGVRTIVFGVQLVVRGARRLGPQNGRAGRRAGSRLARIAADTGRMALAVVLVVIAGGGWWVNTWLAEGAPVVDAFYDPPDEVPAAPGRLIRSDDYVGRIPDGGEVRRILYTTTDAVGRSAVASGIVIIPEGRYGPRPVVAWNHGTTGVARGCAPSLTDAAATRWAVPAVEQALEQGWIVVASDYTGQGAPGVYPYLIGDGEARSTLDAVRAARELDGVSITGDIVTWGHSQGGHAALWTAQLARAYAPELDVLGVAALSPAADPSALARELTAGRASAILSVLISWVLVPYADTYPDVEIADYVAPGGRSIVREMTQRCPTEPGVVVSVLTALGVAADRPLYDARLTDGALGRRLQQNAATGPYGAPLLVAWGTRDEVIPARLHRQFVEDMCANGETVRRLVYRGYDHTRVILPGSVFLPGLIDWTQDRFAGEEAPDDCV